ESDPPLINPIVTRLPSEDTFEQLRLRNVEQDGVAYPVSKVFQETYGFASAALRVTAQSKLYWLIATRPG
ncbi:MAG TPA: hypothetical protein VGK56_10255, partial [Anaerolineales bacterium]